MNKRKHVIVKIYRTVIAVMAIGLLLIVISPFVGIFGSGAVAKTLFLSGLSAFLLTLAAWIIIFNVVQKTVDQIHKL